MFGISVWRAIEEGAKDNYETGAGMIYYVIFMEIFYICLYDGQHADKLSSWSVYLW